MERVGKSLKHRSQLFIQIGISYFFKYEIAREREITCEREIMYERKISYFFLEEL